MMILLLRITFVWCSLQKVFACSIERILIVRQRRVLFPIPLIVLFDMTVIPIPISRLWDLIAECALIIQRPIVLSPVHQLLVSTVIHIPIADKSVGVGIKHVGDIPIVL